jgi:hypothetical protein
MWRVILVLVSVIAIDLIVIAVASIMLPFDANMVEIMRAMDAREKHFSAEIKRQSRSPLPVAAFKELRLGRRLPS